MTNSQQEGEHPGSDSVVGNSNVPRRRRLVTALGSAAGATIENYSVLAYGTASAQYFGDLFFPSTSRLAATLAAFAGLAAGFAMRPLGGILAGYFGDRIGRRPVMIGAVVLMGCATFAIGLLPTYSQIGVWAPILLITCRLLQGIGDGAEWGGAVMLTFEHAPAHRRGLWTGIPQAGVPAGLLLANAAFLVSSWSGSPNAWRWPFLAVAVLVVAGLLLRLRLEESPEFVALENAGSVASNPVREVLRRDFRSILRVIGLRIAETGGFYIATTFLLSYIAATGVVHSSVALLAIVLASAIGLAGHPFFGWLSDRYGRRPVYLGASIYTALLGIPFFLAVNTGNAVIVVVAMILALCVSHDALAGVQGAWFGELFNTRTRTSGASLGYQFTAVIAGVIPFAAEAVNSWIGWIGAALMFSAFGVVTAVVSLLTPETRPGALRARQSSVSQAVKG